MTAGSPIAGTPTGSPIDGVPTGRPGQGPPRVTLGIATYNRDTYLGEAVASCLAQDYDALEVLVVMDGTTNPAVEEVLARFADDPRLRVVRHDTNCGIAAAYNTFVREGRGELVAMLGDDDVCLPGRIRRQVEVFDRHPDTGVVHGDAIVIDAAGRRTGAWGGAELTSRALIADMWRSHNHIVDPTRMVHRRVYETVGGYDDRYPLANDMDFWLRAAECFRFRHLGGEPLVAVRRHADNGSGEEHRAREVDDVERALEASLERLGPRELVPELDWAVLDAAEGERQALLRLADAVARRELPLPGLAERLRARAARIPVPVRRPATRGRLLMTSFGWADSGGGTTVPRLAAKELARRGWDVTVFHAATAPTPSGMPYELSESVSDGVRLIGVHNRPHGLFDLGHPDRELDDPQITRAFEALLDRINPDVVHFHNLHNLGAALIDRVASRGIPAHFTTHNYWLICPRAYLMDGTGAICAGPGDGSRCAECVGSYDPAAHARRLASIRSRAERGLTRILAVSEAVKRALVGAGYDADGIDVVRQAMPHDAEIWEQVGRERPRGRVGERLAVGFLGSALPHKGPQLLVQAAQLMRAEVDVRVFGEIPPGFARTLERIDRRGRVSLEGAFAASEIGALLRGVDVVVLPSMWWDCAPLAAAECLAARTPLVVPRLGGLPEAIREGVDGLTFAGLDAHDLARVLDRLAGEAGLLEHLQAGIEAPRAFSAYVDALEARYENRPGAAADESRTARDADPQTAPAPGAEPAPAVRWQGDHGLPTSLSIINDRITARLEGPVQRVAIDGTALDRPLPHPADVEVRHQWPPDLSPPRSGRLALIQPWEFGAIPVDWLSGLRTHVDELWVPSEYVRAMYLDAGLEPERVVVIPNGVDLETFSPAPDPGGRPGTRFLFVGGLVARKGPDLLFEAFTRAFAGRHDVSLVVKDFGGDGIYRDGDRARFRDHAAGGRMPRIELIEDTLTADELAALYRSCDVFVAPYRGEGFCMPALEAMACGLPVIATAGGPTDEFLPEDAGWRIASHRREFPEERVATLATQGRPWMLEPALADLVRCLREAEATDPDARRTRGAIGRAAAEKLSWEAVADVYRDRIAELAARPRCTAAIEPYPLEGDAELRLLATPAWRGRDRLGELLAAWSKHTTPETSACLYLLADPAIDGAPEELEARVLTAAAEAGADLERCADIDVVMASAHADRDARVHAATAVYVPLHPACAGHERIARRHGSAIVAPDRLGPLLSGLATRIAGLGVA
ncbi:MAG TPA: glycosyltransferase [Solirubrobacteraceae bacterium]|nr:glycosyltransferase [Solirubrobacteraceae bacterium]